MNNQNDQQEINRKRKNNNLHDQNNASNFSKFSTENILRVGEEGEEDEDNDLLTLSLSFPPTNRPRKQSPPKYQPNLPPPSLPLPSGSFYLPPVTVLASSTPTVAAPLQPMRKRRNPSKAAKDGKSDTIQPPFPWATNRRATIHTLDYLLSKQLFTISGDVQCKRCERKYQMEFDLREKFVEIGTYIAENKAAMHDRAPDIWMNPLLPTCQFCKQENSVKPIISEEKSSINWLFLLLGKMLGCCTLDDLKYFCEHTKNHRTGAKDRVLYLTYLTLCKQLDPNGPFDR
ncbi:uncharacterized protein [Nicotiana tomentosiformis]|uniref:uncharacterized protein n=1 Tax=Nicotiana tomentosiformis TaxID=4098 RepID=UPI00051C9669|nr:uncharacterized protein LOC104084484 [Nicotiana tomentosiformis]